MREIRTYGSGRQGGNTALTSTSLQPVVHGPAIPAGATPEWSGVPALPTPSNAYGVPGFRPRNAYGVPGFPQQWFTVPRGPHEMDVHFVPPMPQPNLFPRPRRRPLVRLAAHVARGLKSPREDLCNEPPVGNGSRPP